MADSSIAGKLPDRDTCQRVLTDEALELLPLLDAAFQVRKRFTGKVVKVHIINNAQNGRCPEDCSYCAQAKTSKAPIDEYSMKSEDEILAEAERAYRGGAYRYCMVFSGRGPSAKRVETLARLIRRIKETVPVEVCVSAGLVDRAGAQKLKAAGLDRLNHNLNTSASFYPRICSTHTFQDRLHTLTAAKEVGLNICSGVIAGMGEEPSDLIDLAITLRKLEAESIPVNFLLPIEGNVLREPVNLSPEYCLRILCLYRFLNPKADIRAAAGRESHLRSFEVMSLYPANSIFMDGYLNTTGRSRIKTLQMIRDAGFTIESDFPLDTLLAKELETNEAQSPKLDCTALKRFDELHPARQPNAMGN